MRDAETRGRVEKAFRAFRVDVLRKEIEALERKNEGPEAVWGGVF
jgi:hypothetical protein